MEEYKFNMENIKFGKKKNNIILLKNNDELYLSLRGISGKELSRIKVLHISKIKKLTNFFIRGFNMPLENYSLENMLIPEEDLMESERKILVTGNNSKNKVEKAIKLLESKFDGKLNKAEYPRKMVYLDTLDNQLQASNIIFRLTQEATDVKATMHLNNNLCGDQKHIIKFFFTDTSIPQVVNFFEESLSLVPITREIPSFRTEYFSSIGEFSIDRIKDENVEYYSIEFELDKFLDNTRNSSNIDLIAKNIASKLSLDDCKVVDLGTEAIYNLISGKDYFEVYKINPKER